MSLQNNRNRLLGRFRLKLGFCPRCNSDAPNLYNCHVCQDNLVPKEYWWDQFKMWRVGKDVPSWRHHRRDGRKENQRCISERQSSR